MTAARCIPLDLGLSLKKHNLTLFVNGASNWILTFKVHEYIQFRKNPQIKNIKIRIYDPWVLMMLWVM